MLRTFVPFSLEQQCQAYMRSQEARKRVTIISPLLSVKVKLRVERYGIAELQN